MGGLLCVCVCVCVCMLFMCAQRIAAQKMLDFRGSFGQDRRQPAILIDQVETGVSSAGHNHLVF